MQYINATLVHFFMDLNFLPRFVSGQCRNMLAFGFVLNITDLKMEFDSEVVLSLYDFKNIRSQAKVKIRWLNTWKTLFSRS